MAYAIKYTLAFQSLRGVEYTVNILEDGFAGTAQRLRPAANPLTINEDNGDNYFETIRTQSGYLRIINEATDLDGNTFDYKDLLATNSQSYQVQLISGNNIVWVGYIKPVVLTNTLFGYRNTVEIPIQCPLAVMKSVNLKFNSIQTFPTMAQMIHMFFSRLNIAWNNLYLTANVNHGSGYPFPDLNACVNIFNFSKNEDPTVTSSSFYNYVAEWEDSTPVTDVLDKMCQFFGWSLYTRGLDIYLMAPGLVHDYYEIPFSSLSALLPARTKETADSPTDIADLQYMSTKHNEEYLQGYRKIKITSNANSDDLVMKPYLEDLAYEGFGVFTFGSGDNRWKSAQAWLSNPHQEHRLFNHNVRIYTNPNASGDYYKYNLLSWYDNWKVSATDDYEDRRNNDVKNSFRLKQGTNIYTKSGTPTEPTTRAELEAQTYLGITTLNEVCIPAVSQLCIYAGVNIENDPSKDYETWFQDYIRAYLRIGDYWWTGFGWSTTMSTFKLWCNKKNELLTTRTIYSQETLNALFPGAKGYIIYNDSETRKGIMEFGLLNYPNYRKISEEAGYIRYFLVSDFDIRCVVSDTTIKPQNKNEHEYEGVASLAFQNDLDVSLDMASGTKNLFGKGQLFNSTANGERLTSLSYQDEGAKAPEQHLLENMQRVYGQPRHRMKIEVAESAIHANPLTRFTFNNKTYIMQSAKHEYGDDKMVLTLIEE